MSDEGTSIFRWPDGLVWRGVLLAGGRLRRQRLTAFLRRFPLGPAARVLDVGVTTTGAGACNYLEEAYPWPGSLLACGLEGEPEICRQRGIEYVCADGCALPFAEGQFDVVHSNAVIEHVGSRARQEGFVHELCRVGRAVWITTPNAACPLEPHTLVPFAHWLPLRFRRKVYAMCGRAFWAEETNLNLLDGGTLRRLFPAELRRRVKIRHQYFFGLPAIVIATLG